ncbi:TrlF family AAA-like ATPase [Pseudomonas sp. NPDC087342]|uniref:TrlF family AAA-like ATPase n=1 Tax=Pseudomonas sp. NPDC087342 TaxID=3364437 RepID=UPI0038034BA0
MAGHNRFSKGSEWRKWDLHVHTPASVLENKFGDDWDEYVKILFKKAIEYEIRAIGITDYFLPEGYKILKEQYLNDPAKMASIFSFEEIEKINKIAVFVNIEFRLTKLIIGKNNDLAWNRKVNYHVILSDELEIDLIYSEFVSQIQISFDSATGSQAEKRPLTKSNLENLGRRLIDEHPPFSKSGTPLFVGMMNASVDEEDLIRLLKGNSQLKDKFLLGLPADEDLSDVHWNSQGHSLRKNLIKQAHFIFSSNKGTINFLLGGGDKDRQIREFGSVKPCLWGSDAHDFDKLYLPDGERHTWIKADLTFEGLRQVVYDPISRVRIQDSSPQQKSSYQTIEKVRFVDPSDKIFSSEWQYVNPDLTTIIGGKSSGKSLLLYYIAKAVNSVEVAEKIVLAKATSYKDLVGVDFEVQWSNGEISKLSEPTDSKPITYIPQLYINHLAEEDGREQLNELVKSILWQNEDYKIFSKVQEKLIHDLNAEIDKQVSKIFELRGKFAELGTDLAGFGTRLSIEEEIKSLTSTIQLLREKSGFTPEQERVFLRLTRRKKTFESREAAIKSAVLCSDQVLDSVSVRSASMMTSFRDAIVADVDMSPDSTFLNGLFDSLNAHVLDSLKDFESEVKHRMSNKPKLIQVLKAKIAAVDVELLPLMQKVKDQSELDLCNNKLRAEELKLKAVAEIESKRNALKLEGGQVRGELHDKFKELVNKYKEYASEVEKPEYQPEEGIRIYAEVGFAGEKFSEFTKLFDGRGNLSNLVGALVDVKGDYQFDVEHYSDWIVDVDKRLLRPNADIPARRKGVSESDVTRRLFSDCLYIGYVVRYREDEIAKMSPGKRGLVLLNLILHLSNASHPILIDQPEDNLDNRTIYDQLNCFIRERKAKRQIIMVTHNANLVVAADSECIVVANQAGQQANLENEKFKFEYCSGSLELSYEDLMLSGMLKRKGIRQHVCEILEGGVIAFKERELKYGFRT